MFCVRDRDLLINILQGCRFAFPPGNISYGSLFGDRTDLSILLGTWNGMGYWYVLCSLNVLHKLTTLDAFIDMTQNAFGYATYGYWKWHNTEEAVKDCNENVRRCFESCGLMREQSR